MPHLGNLVVSELPVRLEGRHNVQRLARRLARTDRASVHLGNPRENGGRPASEEGIVSVSRAESTT